MQQFPNAKRLFIWFAGLVLALLPLSAWAANLLQNAGLEPPFVKYGEWDSGQGKIFDLEVAHGWERFFIPAGTYNGSDNRLRYFRSSALEFLYHFTEKRDGVDAQLFWSKNPFDAGIYQQITGLTPGENYGVQAGILQVYGKTTRTPENGRMFRSLGIDPTGGTDPTSPNVIWGPEESRTPNWFYPGVGARAISSTMTVFVRVRSLYDAPTNEENSVWVDDTFMDIAPTTSLNLTADSPTQVSAQWSGSPRSGFHLFAYEAQYRQSAASNWTDLQIFSSTSPASTSTGKSFAVTPGVEYMVRARTWHEQDGGDSHEIPGPWVEKTIVTGGLITGQVLNSEGNPVSGATVTATGRPAVTTTSGGAFELNTGAGDFSVQAIAGNYSSSVISVTVPTVTAIVPLTLTLRPPDEAITNGDFDAGLAGWTLGGTPAVTSSAEFRSGGGSMALTGNGSASQITSVTNMYRPVLSFWYKLAGDGNDTFSAYITPSGGGVWSLNSSSFTTPGDWQFVSLPLNQSEVYTGPILVSFDLTQSGGLSDTVVYVDEVSVGKSWGGPNKSYLPVVLK